MNLENITLSKLSQSQKDEYCMYDSTYMRYLVKFISTESRTLVTRGWREGVKGELLFNGYRISISKKKKSWRSGNVLIYLILTCEQCEYT